MSYICSFAPIEDEATRILILGSMPGKKSLKAGQYYAHPRNAFWPIMGDLVGATPILSYELRIQKLKDAGIAVWDVLASCIRHSSLDADIDKNSISSNDFQGFLSAHPYITHIFFNGKMAEKYFQLYVKLKLGNRALLYQCLPSTSPANASIPYNQKLNAWKVINKLGQI